eukprot:GGOE01056136.1.p1 GENE.GGOE01056136.1~~GGOE01056136.1.p1  ORF type:complete len:355 (+),score=101.33 GGOE01056136.1:77-1141(+)
MPVDAPEVPCLAVALPEDVNVAHCVTGTVVVDQHRKDIRTLHSQLLNMMIIETPECRLRIATHIADGTWSCVYHVCEEESGQSYALKVIPNEGTNVSSAYARIALVKKLSHSNVVKYHNHFARQYGGVSCLCIQMEYCSSGLLSDYIRVKAHHKSSLSATRVQDFATQLASALAYIHDQGFIHGDLRSANVLMEKKQLKLMSFGSPLWLERRGLTPRCITGGCKAYAPPEWMDSEVPHRDLQEWEKPLSSYDMWSLGCVLSELVTLKLLRNDRHHWGTALASDPADLQGVSQEVAATHDGLFSPLLERLLDTDPEARMTASEALTELRGLHPRTTIPLVQLCMPFTRVITTPWA